MRQHINPFENNHRDTNLDIQAMRHGNGNFAVPNFAAEKMPPVSNSITNVHSPDQPVVPGFSIFTADQVGSKNRESIPPSGIYDADQIGTKIRAHVDQVIAEAWSDAPPFHDIYRNDMFAAKMRGHKLPPKAVPDFESSQQTAPHNSASRYDTTEQRTPEYSQSQRGGGQSYHQQSGDSISREESQGQSGGNSSGDGSADRGYATDNLQKSSLDKNTPIHTGAARDLTICGPPTISAQTIDAVLEANDSPAKGCGQTIFNLCTKAGIDPAIALAIFGCESSFGTDGIATKTQSWGNIRSTDGSGIDGFASYPDFMVGLEKWTDLMNDLYVAPPDKGGFGFTTMDQALTKYAPPSENDTQGYANKVANFVSQWRAQEAELPHNDTSELGTALDSGRNGIGTIGDVTDDNLQKMFFTQFKHPDWNNFDDAPDSSSNCGPASVAMALRILGVQPNGVELYGDPNPLVSKVRQLMTEDRTPEEEARNGAGTDVSEASRAAQKLGLTTETVGGIDDINKALDAGKPVVLGGDPVAYNTGMTGDDYATHPGPGGSRVVFTGGHVISVVGRNYDGTYKVMDPAYKKGILNLSASQLRGFMAPDGAAPGVAIGKAGVSTTDAEQHF